MDSYRRLVIFYLKCAAYKSTYLLTYYRPRVTTSTMILQSTVWYKIAK